MRKLTLFLIGLLCLQVNCMAEPSLPSVDETLGQSKEFETLSESLTARAHRKRKASYQTSNEILFPIKILPYAIDSVLVQSQRSLFYAYNIGVGFLYFRDVRGNIPIRFGAGFYSLSGHKMQGSFTYNRTPLMEFIWGINLFSFLKVGVSYQHQSGVIIRSALQYNTDFYVSPSPTDRRRGYFTSNFEVDAIMLKVYVLSPFSIVWLRQAFTSYLGFGGGCGWQTWANPTVINIQGNGNSDLTSDVISLRQKISANGVFIVDPGVRITSLVPELNMTFSMGCKFNYWGQARSMGKYSQAASTRWGAPSLLQPIAFKNVYSFAPYLGVQWQF